MTLILLNALKVEQSLGRYVMSFGKAPARSSRSSGTEREDSRERSKRAWGAAVLPATTMVVMLGLQWDVARAGLSITWLGSGLCSCGSGFGERETAQQMGRGLGGPCQASDRSNGTGLQLSITLISQWRRQMLCPAGTEMSMAAVGSMQASPRPAPRGAGRHIGEDRLACAAETWLGKSTRRSNKRKERGAGDGCVERRAAPCRSGGSVGLPASLGQALGSTFHERSFPSAAQQCSCCCCHNVRRRVTPQMSSKPGHWQCCCLDPARRERPLRPEPSR